MKQLNYLGHWQEQGYDNRASILTQQNKEQQLSPKLEQQLETYLTQAYCLRLHERESFCLFAGNRLDGSTLTDGKWLWSKDTWYYHKEQHIQLPLAFIATVERSYKLSFAIKKNLIKYFTKGSIKRKHLRFLGCWQPYTCSIASGHNTVAYFEIADKQQNHKELTALSAIFVHRADEFQQMMADEKKRLSDTINFSATFSYISTTKRANKLLIQVNILAFSPQILRAMIGQQFCISQNRGSYESLYEEAATLVDVETIEVV